jgi:hypothetical protein
MIIIISLSLSLSLSYTHTKQKIKQIIWKNMAQQLTTPVLQLPPAVSMHSPTQSCPASKQGCFYETHHQNCWYRLILWSFKSHSKCHTKL